jgi:hypothetical protein
VTRGLERLLAAARRVSGAEAGTIYLRRGEVLEFAAVQNDVLARHVGEDEVRRRVGARPLPLRENSIAGYVMLTRATVNLRDAYQIPVDRPYTLFREVDRTTDYRTRSMLALPLRRAAADQCDRRAGRGPSLQPGRAASRAGAGGAERAPARGDGRLSDAPRPTPASSGDRSRPSAPSRPCRTWDTGIRP